MSKLTLSVDRDVIARAKHYANERGISISEMVEAYLASVAEPIAAKPNTPILDSLRGSLKTVDIEDYRRHLEAKHRG